MKIWTSETYHVHEDVYVCKDIFIWNNFLLRSMLQNALKETERPVRVTSECLYMREGRQGIDRVRDKVEQGMEREIGNIRNVQNRMQATLDQVGVKIIQCIDRTWALKPYGFLKCKNQSESMISAFPKDFLENIQKLRFWSKIFEKGHIIWIFLA